jgi:hypothetical protein
MMSFVDEIFRDNRNINDASRTVGNAEKSNGRSTKSVVVKIRIAKPKDAVSPVSNTQAGIGKIIMTMMPINAIANKIVGWKKLEKISWRVSVILKQPFGFAL